MARATLRSSILELNHRAGNRAVAGLLQRKVGWTDGKKWNDDEHPWGEIRRIPLEGLAEGLDAKVQGADGRKIPSLSSESATGKAIVLVPKALNARSSIEVIVFLHGFTEDRGRPYAGWRELVDPKPSTAGPEDVLKERLPRLRQGIDGEEKAPVRDLALDQVEQQLEESHWTQLVIVLPQGGLHSEFSREGTQDFDADRYVSEIVTRLKAEQKWQDGKGKVVDVEPSVTRVTMAGTAAPAQALSEMTNEAVKAKRGEKPVQGRAAASQLGPDRRPRDLRRDQRLPARPVQGVDEDAARRLAREAHRRRGDRRGQAMAPEPGPEAARLHHDDVHQRSTSRSRRLHQRLVQKNGAKLGEWAPCLRTNFALDFVPVSHEELMRGSFAGTPRAPGTGTILQAIRDLHPRALHRDQRVPADAQAAEGTLRGVEEGPEGEEVTAAAEAIRLPRAGSRREQRASTWLESRQVALTLRPGLHPV